MVHFSFECKSSSTDEIYYIDINNKNGLTILHCTCRAGENGQICHHRTRLLRRDYSLLIDADKSQLERAEQILQSSLGVDLLKTIDALEIEAQRLKISITTKKKSLAHIILSGAEKTAP